MVNFLHFSDFHIPDKPGDYRNNTDLFQKLDNLIEHTQKLQLNPSFTIITGDLSHTGTTQSYKHVKKIIKKLENLGGPVFPTTGNKDNPSNFTKILLEKPSHQKDSPCYYSKTIEGIHVIALDSRTPGSNMGLLGEKQLDWLETELDVHEDLRSVIAFHDPIYFFGELGLFNKSDACRFRDIVSAGNVLAVLNGHLHCPLYGFVDGVNFVQAGSSVEMRVHSDSGRVLTFDSSSFNLLGYSKNILNSLAVRPIYYSEGQQLVDKTN